ncbi:hypothetical protein ES702_01370 [subsurface metagenome]
MNNSKSNQKFKIGDKVQLKSGGPIMTVNSITEKTGEIYCKWFVGEYDKVYYDYFQPDILQLVVKPHKKGTVKYRDL